MNELAKMARTITAWTEEDTMMQVELVAEVNQPLTPESLSGVEIDWITTIRTFL